MSLTGFELCQGFRFLPLSHICYKWMFYLYHLFSELKIYHLSLLSQNIFYWNLIVADVGSQCIRPDLAFTSQNAKFFVHLFDDLLFEVLYKKDRNPKWSVLIYLYDWSSALLYWRFLKRRQVMLSQRRYCILSVFSIILRYKSYNYVNWKCVVTFDFILQWILEKVELYIYLY